MSYSTSTSPRARRKSPDPMVIGLILLSIVAVPVVGFVAWKESRRDLPAPPPKQVQRLTDTRNATAVATKPARQDPKAFDKFNKLGSKYVLETGADGSPVLPNTPAPEESYEVKLFTAPRTYSSSRSSNSSRTSSSTVDLSNPGSSGGMQTPVATNDASGAVEDLGKNLQNVLDADGKWLVIWLFDKTASADAQRADVARQIPGMYERLKAPAGSGPDDAPVLSVVGAFGATTEFLTSKPTADATAVQEAIQKIQANADTRELTFSAVKAALDKYLEYRTRKGRFVAIVVVTDEVGDDEAVVDDLLQTLVRYQIPVYAIAQEASFGRTDGGGMGTEGPKPGPGDKGPVTNYVRQGPESREPEWVRLDFSPGTNVSGASLDFGTGLGPYSLTRLCVESGGACYALPQPHGAVNTLLSTSSSLVVGDGAGDENAYWDAIRNGKAGKFNMQSFASGTAAQDLGKPSLRGFAPRYMTEAEYKSIVDGNKALKALIEASKLSRIEALGGVQQSFPIGKDDAALTKALQDAQKPVARVRPPIDRLYDLLKQGEADAPKLSEPRWKAGYYLALGRALAAKARADGYIEMCGKLISNPKFQKENSSAWYIERTNEPTGISTVDKGAMKAREMLSKVVKDYPGTPWARVADMEMEVPMGWKWQER